MMKTGFVTIRPSKRVLALFEDMAGRHVPVTAITDRRVGIIIPDTRKSVPTQVAPVGIVKVGGLKAS
jgi:hypothetical protein